MFKTLRVQTLSKNRHGLTLSDSPNLFCSWFLGGEMKKMSKSISGKVKNVTVFFVNLILDIPCKAKRLYWIYNEACFFIFFLSSLYDKYPRVKALCYLTTKDLLCVEFRSADT